MKPPQCSMKKKNDEDEYEKLVGSATKAGLFSTLKKEKLLEDWTVPCVLKRKIARIYTSGA